ncbi:MAG TPA: hypothetical protein VIG33_14660 [Pseudobdellovibrionaceae bacterium]|jgi:hypothetical protein
MDSNSEERRWQQAVIADLKGFQAFNRAQGVANLAILILLVCLIILVVFK